MSHGRTVSPRLIRDPSTFDSIASHWRTWASTNTYSTRSKPFVQPIEFDKSPLDAAVATTSTTAAKDDATSAHDLDSAEHVQQQPSTSSDPLLPSCAARIAWSAWDEISVRTTKRRILVIAYKSLGLTIWDCSALDAWYEILNLRSIADLAPTSTWDDFDSIAGACILPKPTVSTAHDSAYPLLAILARSSKTNRSHTLVYSLCTHKLIHSWSLPGIGHRIASNSRQVVISTSSPLSLHCYSATDFSALTFSPIRDLAPSPDGGAPVFDLGRGGRLLAYVTDQKVINGSSSAARFNEYDNARSGAGIMARRGFFDSDEPPSSSPSSQRNEFTIASSSSGTSAHYDRAAFFEDAKAVGAVGGDVAKRVGGGMLYGAKAIGQLGYQAWTSASNARAGTGANTTASLTSDHDTEASAKIFSRSAPLPSVPGWERKTSSSSNVASPKLSGAHATRDVPQSPTAGTIKVIDLVTSSTSRQISAKPRARSTVLATPTVVAHFRAFNCPVSFLSFSPSSSSILVAPSHAHCFEVFELKIRRQAHTHHAHLLRINQVWHRYRLNRGLSSARTTSVSWSDDARFVTVGTGKGTTHVYALNPYGGRPDLSTILKPHVVNERDLAPLSTSLSTVARIRLAPTTDSPSNENTAFLPPQIRFVTKLDALASSLRPDQTVLHRSLAPSFQDLLLFYPSTGTCLLERLTSSPAASTTTEAVSKGDVGRLASTAVSGLTQLMKSRGVNAGASTGASAASDKREWVIAAVGRAEWSLARSGEVLEVKEAVGGDQQSSTSETGRKMRYSAQAEIETFSRSAKILPRSIYSSQQFTFFALPRDHVAQTAQGRTPAPLRRLEMRSEVEIREGGSALSVDRDESSPIRTVASSFDQPIKSAMQTILDDPSVFHPSSSSSPTDRIDPFSHPGFPNGLAGKQGRHAHSGLAIPIRVGAIARQGLVSTVRGVVAMSVPAGQHLRRRTSNSTTTYSSSVSFEEDAVFPNSTNAGGGVGRDDESASTGFTSELDECDDLDVDFGIELDDEIEKDEVNWPGWESTIETTKQGFIGSGTRHSESIAEDPFEEDFDDLGPEKKPNVGKSAVGVAAGADRGKAKGSKKKAKVNGGNTVGSTEVTSTPTTSTIGDDSP